MENKKCHMVFDDQRHVIIKSCFSTGPEVQNHSLDLGQGDQSGFQSYSYHPSSESDYCSTLQSATLVCFPS